MGLISYPLQDERREAVRLLVDAFVSVWEGADYGPAHIALSDYNLLDDNLKFCLRLVNSIMSGTPPEEYKDSWKDHSYEELASTASFLVSLQHIPEEWRDIHAETVEDDE